MVAGFAPASAGPGAAVGSGSASIAAGSVQGVYGSESQVGVPAPNVRKHTPAAYTVHSLPSTATVITDSVCIQSVISLSLLVNEVGSGMPPPHPVLA